MNKTLKIVIVIMLFISLIEIIFYLTLKSPDLSKNLCLKACKQEKNSKINTLEYQAIQQDRIDALKTFKKGVLQSFIITTQFEGTITEYSYTENPLSISLTILGNQGNQNSFMNIDPDIITDVKFLRVKGIVTTPITYKDLNIGDKIILITQSDMMSNSADWMKRFEIKQIAD